MPRKEQLKIGNCYFMIRYYTEKTNIPDIWTYVYLGKDIYAKQPKSDDYYFQEIEHYLKPDKNDDKKSPADKGIMMLELDCLYLMYDVDSLINTLNDLKKSLDKDKKS